MNNLPQIAKKAAFNRLSVFASTQALNRLTEQGSLNRTFGSQNQFYQRPSTLDYEIYQQLNQEKNIRLNHLVDQKQQVDDSPHVRKFWEKWLGGKNEKQKQEAKHENGWADDQQDSDNEDVWEGARRPGGHHKQDEEYPQQESMDDEWDNSDDDDDHGGQMMPIPDV